METVLKAIGFVLLVLAFWRINIFLHACLDLLFDSAMFKDLDEENK